MSHFEEQTGKAFPGKVLLTSNRAGYSGIDDMEAFVQTPSAGAFGYVSTEAEGLPPHQLFHLFTAAIIIEEKVFVR